MSKAWTINIKYKTGDSFSTHDTEDTVGMVWLDLERAKEALQVLKKHHNAVTAIARCYKPDEKKRLIAEYSTEYWFMNGKSYEESYEYNIRVRGDGDDMHRIYAFWNGYFEHIQSAHIVLHNSSEDLNDMDVYF